jgi:hypothetical protein
MYWEEKAIEMILKYKIGFRWSKSKYITERRSSWITIFGL